MTLHLSIFVCFFAFILGSAADSIHSQKLEPALIWSQLKVPSGISVEVGIQDGKGYVWAGGFSGLVRFDGSKSEKIFANPDTQGELRMDSIRDLLTDSEGTLWIATSDGLYRYRSDRENFDSFFKDQENPQSIQHDSLYALSLDQHGNIWSAGWNYTLQCWHKETGEIERIPFNVEGSGVYITDVLVDSHDRVWALTSFDGFYLRESAADEFKEIQSLPNDPLPNNAPSSFYEDSIQQIWLLHNQQLYQYNETLREFEKCRLPPETISHVDAFLPAENGSFWAASSEAIIRFSRDLEIEKIVPGHLYPDPTKGAPVIQLFNSQDGLLWAIQSIDGIYVLNGISDLLNQFSSYQWEKIKKDGFDYPEFSNVLPLGDRFMIIHENVINSFDPQTSVFEKITEFDASIETANFDPVLESLSQEDPRGDKWLLTPPNTLWHWSKETGNWNRYLTNDPQMGFTEPSFLTLKCMISSNGDVWLISWNAGAYRWIPEQKRFKNYLPDFENPSSIGNNWIYDVEEDQQGQLWFGLWDGLSLYHPEDDSFSSYIEHYSGITSDIYPDPDGSLWLATKVGLIHWDTIEKTILHRYHFDHGFTDLRLQSIVPQGDGDVLWVSTKNGLFEFSKSKEIAHRYGDSNGLTSNDFIVSGERLENGYILMPNNHALLSFNPQEIVINDQRLNVHINSIQVNNGKIPFRKQLELGSHENVLSFEFTAPNFINAELTEYKYILLGHDRDWIQGGLDNHASYAKLKPGSYEFRVNAANSDGQWSDEDAVVSFVIKPPWHQTTWAYFLYLIFGIAVIYTLIDFVNTRKHARALRKAKDAAVEASQAKTLFVANMSHEIRTPMTAILGFTDILFMEETEPSKRSSLDIIRSSGENLLALIDDILDFSRIEASKLTISSEPVSIAGLISEVLRTYRQKAAEKGIKLRSEVDSTIDPYLEGDELRIKQIIVNLLGNALKFTDRGEVVIRASRYPTENPETIKLKIEVRDSGIGIPEDQLDVIFDVFAQRKNQDARVYRGTGLGLAISKKLATLMNATLTVESEVGVGSRFCLEFEEIRRVHMVLEEENEDLPIDVSDLPKITILIADDLPLNREVIQGFFSNSAVKTLTAKNGREVLTTIRNEQVDLILLDMRMPGMDGYEATRHIKENDATKHIPIIAISASVLKSEEDQMIATGCDAFLPKPISRSDLYKSVIKYSHSQGS